MTKQTEPTIEVCGVCGEVGRDLEFDEHMGRFVCCECDVKREVGHDSICGHVPNIDAGRYDRSRRISHGRSKQ